MFKSISYVIKENFSNVYRIFCIAKYELLSDMRDSKFGIFWNFASPAIQVFTYWLVFGIAWGRKAQTYRGITVEYLPWLVVAFSVWWYIRPCIVDGCSAVFSKTNVITRMKFPVSVLTRNWRKKKKEKIRRSKNGRYVERNPYQELYGFRKRIRRH